MSESMIRSSRDLRRMPKSTVIKYEHHIDDTEPLFFVKKDHEDKWTKCNSRGHVGNIPSMGIYPINLSSDEVWLPVTVYIPGQTLMTIPTETLVAELERREKLGITA